MGQTPSKACGGNSTVVLFEEAAPPTICPFTAAMVDATLLGANLFNIDVTLVIDDEDGDPIIDCRIEDVPNSRFSVTVSEDIIPGDWEIFLGGLHR